MTDLLYNDYLEGTAKVLAESKKETEKYTVTVLDKQFVVHPNVFSPKYFFDTEFFARMLPDVRGEDFLEIGPGTGVISVIAALNGAKRVTAVDINPSAVANTKENAALHGVSDRVTVYEGNLYAPLPNDAKFDTIFWNTPFGYIEDDNISVLEKAVYDPGYTSTKTFINDASYFLKKDGRILIGFSTTLGSVDLLQELLKKAGYTVHLLSQTESMETHPVSFELFEALPSIQK